MYKRLRAALLKYLQANPVLVNTMAKHNIGLSQISVADLPSDFEFEGDRYVNGKACKTVGEYKDACDKLYGNQ